jgi:hypothetical protein
MTEDASYADLYAGTPEDYAMALKRPPRAGRAPPDGAALYERRAEYHAARSGRGSKEGSVGSSSGQASICGPSFPGRADLPSMVYIIDAMYEIDLEPEVEAWLLHLPYSHYQRVMRNVDDFLVTGGVPDGDHVKKLQDPDDIYELRVALDRTTWRISFWKPGGRVIILLTVFRKTRRAFKERTLTGPSEQRRPARQNTT